VSPLILALDTTSELGSIALLRGEELLEEVQLHAPTGFAQIIYQHLREILDRHGVAVGAIDCFAAAAGPGSFTGVRVGLACIKGLAEAEGKPAVAVSNLQALAAHGTAALRAPIIDARRNEIYTALYDAKLTLVRPEVVTARDAWVGALPAGTELIEPAGPCPLAAAVAKIAHAGYLRGEAADPAALDANYVRPPDIRG